MVLGTAAANKQGDLYLSELGMRRCDRVAEAYYGTDFDRIEGLILVSGGYGKLLFDAPPEDREAVLMAGYLERVYYIPQSAMLIEDESTDTKENFDFSVERFPDFFKNIKYGEEVLGLVSHSDHLVKASKIGRRAINCSERQLVEMPTQELIEEISNIATSRHATFAEGYPMAAD